MLVLRQQRDVIGIMNVHLTCFCYLRINNRDTVCTQLFKNFGKFQIEGQFPPVNHDTVVEKALVLLVEPIEILKNVRIQRGNCFNDVRWQRTRERALFTDRGQSEVFRAGP